jgi:hypothetical protein
MDGIERIRSGNKVIALVIRNGLKFDGPNNFLSEKEYQLQVGLHKCKSGHIFKPHIHKNISRIIKGTEEILYIKSGQILVEFYGDDLKKICESILEDGDIVHFIGGGHGINVLKDCVIFEVKQGPYSDRKKDKEYNEVGAEQI